MNRLELLIYNAVKDNPRLKKRIVDAYQRAMSVVPAPRERSAYPIRARAGHFFGFHDKCPWSQGDRMLLSHRYTIPLRMPRAEEPVEVGYFTGPDFAKFRPLATTRAWNWQMGAQLQWVGPGTHLIFNDVEGGEHVARVLDSEGRTVTTVARPIAAVSPDGTKAACHEFARLRRCASGYGYATGSDPDDGIEVPAERTRGLSIADLGSGQMRHLFSVADIAALDPHPTMRGAYHYFTHPLFNPSGSRLVFFHRWLVNNNKTWTRMLSCDPEGQDLFIFPTESVVSHLAWRDDDHILAYGTARGRREAYAYVLFQDRVPEYELIGAECFTSDGHPQFSPDRRWILTDTYPDRFRIQYLILYDTLRRRRYNLAKLRSPLRFDADVRCDLHPRWNRAGTIVCFDSSHTGERALCTIAVGALRENCPPRAV